MSKDALAEVMKNVLKEAEREECHILTVPAISSGLFGFPKDLCAEILLTTTVDMLKKNHFHSLKEIHFVNKDDPAVQVFSDKLAAFFGEQPEFKRFKNKEELNKSLSVSLKKKTLVFVGTETMSNTQEEHQSAIPKSNAVIQQPSDANAIEMELVIDDLGKVTADVIVNSTSANLDLSKNPCARSLSKDAGPSLQKECTAWVGSNGQLPLYSFAETKSGQMICKKVLHATCGKKKGQDSEYQLKNLIMKLLETADEGGSASIAIPGLGTGRLKSPKVNVAKIIVDCVRNFTQSTNLERVMLVAHDKDADMIKAFKNALTNEGDASPRQKKIRKAPSLSSSLLEEESLFFKLGDVELEIKCGDITKESIDTIVALGDEDVRLLGAVGNAIKNSEGEEFMGRAQSKAPQRKGTTMFLKTFKLPSKYIAHTIPMSESYDDLKPATKGMFKRCNSMSLKSISLPASGTGALEKTPEESAKLILHSFVELAIEKRVCNIKKVNIVLFEEKLVLPFKKGLREIAEDPNKSVSNKGVISWIKENLKMLMRSLLSSNEGKYLNDESNSLVRNPSLDNLLTPVVFNVYFSYDKRVVKEVRERMMKVLDDHITSSDVQKEMFKKLPSYHFEKITSFARLHDVRVDLDTNAGKIKLIGYYKDLAAVTGYCHDIAAGVFEDEQRREKEQTVAKYVQWKEKQNDGSMCDYDPELNYQIETHYNEKKNGAQINIADDDAIITYELDFSNMKIINKDGEEEKILIREELVTSRFNYDLPSHWDPMPSSSSGLEAKVHCVQLQPSSQEFQNVSSKFMSSSGGKIHNKNIVKIERIQNPQLYTSYLAKKQSMERTAGETSINELELFHGTNPSSVTEINEYGFNRSFAGVNGTAYGIGVYFAKDAKYSVSYASRSASLPRCMYLAKVLAGKYTVGDSAYKVAPKGFDTVVDKPNSPRIHVVFYDNQCYPEYLLHFN